LFFPVLVETVGINATFYGFAVCAAIGIVIVSTMVPETKGKTLVEIEEYFRTKG
jgi:major inositol transporter-like SP family MFS transporter